MSEDTSHDIEEITDTVSKTSSKDKVLLGDRQFWLVKIIFVKTYEQKSMKERQAWEKQ